MVHVFMSCRHDQNISCRAVFLVVTKDNAMTTSLLARYMYVCVCVHHAWMLWDYNLYQTELIPAARLGNLFKSICLLLDFCTEANVCRYVISNVL